MASTEYVSSTVFPGLDIPVLREPNPSVCEFVPDIQSLRLMIEGENQVPLGEALKNLPFVYDGYNGYSIRYGNDTAVTSEHIHAICGEKGLDPETIRLIHLPQVVDEVISAADIPTKASEYAITRNLYRLTTSPELIEAREEAIRELEANPELRKAMDRIYRVYSEFENIFLLVQMNGFDFRGLFENGYGIYREFRNGLRSLAKEAEGLTDRPNSTYLQMLLEDISGLQESLTYRLANHGIVRTPDGLMPENEVQSNMQKAVGRFYPSIFSRDFGFMAGTYFLGSAALFTTVNVPTIFNPPEPIMKLTQEGFAEVAVTVSPPELFSTMQLLLMGPVILGFARLKPCYDTISVGQPYNEIIQKEGALGRMTEAFGRYGELCAYLDYDRESPSEWESCHAEVLPSDRHFIELHEARSPLFRDNPHVKPKDYVPNDLCLVDHSFNFLTGPVTGGKTTIARLMCLFQVMGQANMKVPAQSAVMGIADIVKFLENVKAQQDDPEGSFGTAWAHTSSWIYRMTPHSVLVMDDFGEGFTTRKEMDANFCELTDTLMIKQPTVIFSSHQTALAKKYSKRGLGAFLMTELVGSTRDPRTTFKLVAGISTKSGSKRVRERLGYATGDYRRHLEQFLAES